jgi:membrane-associated protease RseP (regulator of RpoE activity)
MFMGYTPLGNYTADQPAEMIRRKSRWVLHLGLFVLTFMSTLMAGAQWSGQNPLEVMNWGYGLQYAVLIMLFLASHEFGHYFAARYHGVDATLPYFIPVPPIGMPFGTLGAVIRTQSPIMTRKALFDIGIAGPLAGFVMCVAFLIVGFATLPPQEFLFSIHPEYRVFGGAIPEFGLYFGDTMLYNALAKIFANPNGWLPPMNEVYHYPFLCVGWFGLFVTALNLLPIGQLDGGHISYAMFGEKQSLIGRYAWRFIFLLGLGWLLGVLFSSLMYDSPDGLYTFFQSLFMPPLVFLHRAAPWFFGSWSGWMFWAVILRFLIRIDHPEVEDHEPLGAGRMALGWCAWLILVVSFSVNGLYEVERTPQNEIPNKRRGGGSVVEMHVQGNTMNTVNNTGSVNR